MDHVKKALGNQQVFATSAHKHFAQPKVTTGYSFTDFAPPFQRSAKPQLWTKQCPTIFPLSSSMISTSLRFTLIQIQVAYNTNILPTNLHVAADLN